MLNPLARRLTMQIRKEGFYVVKVSKCPNCDDFGCIGDLTCETCGGEIYLSEEVRLETAILCIIEDLGHVQWPEWIEHLKYKF